MILTMILNNNEQNLDSVFAENALVFVVIVYGVRWADLTNFFETPLKTF